MELKKIIKTIEKNRPLLITATFIGLVLGIIFYFLPSKYISSGSFYVSKKTDKSLDFFPMKVTTPTICYNVHRFGDNFSKKRGY